MYAGRVQQLPYLLPQGGEQRHHPHQGQTGKQGQPPPAGGEVAHALGEDHPDGGLLRGQAEAQEGDAGLVEDGVGELEDQPGEKLGQQVGEEVEAEVFSSVYPSAVLQRTLIS